MRLLSVGLLAGCNDSTLTINKVSPEASIVTPTEGTVFLLGESVALEGRVRDLDTPSPLDLTVSWGVNSAGDAVTTGDTNDDGGTFANWVPSVEGSFVITLRVTDPDGMHGEDAINVTVVANQAPTIILHSPADGDIINLPFDSEWSGQVADVNDGPASLDLSWTTSGIQLAECNGSPDGSGVVTCVPADLSTGDSIPVCLTATDPHGAFESACATVEIRLCQSTTWYADNDEDGYGLSTSTITSCDAPVGYVAMDGDCNDNDSAVNPGEVEICNGIDDDCDNSTGEGCVELCININNNSGYDCKDWVSDSSGIAGASCDLDYAQDGELWIFSDGWDSSPVATDANSFTELCATTDGESGDVLYVNGRFENTMGEIPLLYGGEWWWCANWYGDGAAAGTFTIEGTEVTPVLTAGGNGGYDCLIEIP